MAYLEKLDMCLVDRGVQYKDSVCYDSLEEELLTASYAKGILSGSSLGI